MNQVAELVDAKVTENPISTRMQITNYKFLQLNDQRSHRNLLPHSIYIKFVKSCRRPNKNHIKNFRFKRVFSKRNANKLLTTDAKVLCTFRKEHFFPGFMMKERRYIWLWKIECKQRKQSQELILRL